MTFQCYAVVFISSFECEEYISRAIESLINQTFQGFHIILIDDASLDKTSIIAKDLLEDKFPNRYSLIRNETNIGKSANAFIYLNQIEASFVAVLDGDDAIIDDSILQEYNHAYRMGYDAVWSNYRTNDGRFGHCRPIDPTKNPRAQGWRSSHLFSFRHSLLKKYPGTLFQGCKWCLADICLRFIHSLPDTGSNTAI